MKKKKDKDKEKHYCGLIRILEQKGVAQQLVRSHLTRNMSYETPNRGSTLCLGLPFLEPAGHSSPVHLQEPLDRLDGSPWGRTMPGTPRRRCSPQTST